MSKKKARKSCLAEVVARPGEVIPRSARWFSKPILTQAEIEYGQRLARDLK